MDALVALALSIGVLIAGWTYVALGPGALPVWAGIVAWGCFFAAGGKTEGLVKTIASNLSGVLWAFLALTAWNRFGGGTAVSVVVGASGSWSRTIIALLIGAVLGYLSEMLAGALTGSAKRAAA